MIFVVKTLLYRLTVARIRTTVSHGEGPGKYIQYYWPVTNILTQIGEDFCCETLQCGFVEM